MFNGLVEPCGRTPSAVKKDTNKSFEDSECDAAELVTLFGDFTVACMQTPLKRINALVVG
jgi:hypothetical protein